MRTADNAGPGERRHVEHSPFLGLLIVTGLALTVPILLSRSRRMAIPIVVGEILAGVAVGRSGLNLVEDTAILAFLAEFGFAFLMFLSGLEVDFGALSRRDTAKGDVGRLRSPVVLTLLWYAGTLAASYGIAALVVASGAANNAILLTLILSTSSLGIVLAVLKGRDLLGGSYGQMLLAAATLADFATLILLTVAVLLFRDGITVDLLLLPAFLVVFLGTSRLLVHWIRQPALVRLIEDLSNPTSQIRVRAAFALMIVSVVLAEAIGVELILGAFLAGIVFRLLGYDHEAEVARERLEAIGFGFFIPIFFISVGVNFNLPALLESPELLGLLPLLVAGAFVVKIVPGLIFRLRLGWRQTIGAGFLLSARLSLLIAASEIALSLGAINEGLNSALVLLAIVMATFSPLAFGRLAGRGSPQRRRRYLLVGKDPMVEVLAVRLQREGYPVAVVGPEQAAAERLVAAGVRVFTGPGDDPDTLRRAGAAEARGVMTLGEEAPTAGRICRLATLEFQVPLVVASVRNADEAESLRNCGARVVQPGLATAVALEAALRFPGVFDVLARTDDGMEMAEVEVVDSRLAGRRLAGLGLRGNALALSLHRGEEAIIPHGQTMIQLGDRLGLIGSHDALEAARKFLGD